MTTRVLVVDDEPYARRRLSRLLAAEPDIEIVGECPDGMSAVAAVERLAPHVMFIDVKMPLMNGFEVLKHLPAVPRTRVVFVTAFDEYAVRAFEVNAVDYLVKPVDPQRLREALRRACEQMRQTAFADGDRTDSLRPAPVPALPTAGASIAIRVRGHVRVLAVDDIQWLRARGKHVRIHTLEETQLVRQPLRALLARLDPARFARIHRSIVVGMAHIREIEPGFHGDSVVVLKSGAELPLSRIYRAQLVRALGQAF